MNLEKQQTFNEFMEEYKKLELSQKQDELLDKLKSIFVYLNVYAMQNNIEYTPIKSRELNDLDEEATVDDYLEVMMVYSQNIEELLGLVIENKENIISIDDVIKKDKNIEEKISKWIKEGIEMIFPERYVEWEKCVRSSVNSLYKGRIIEEALEVMKTLKSGKTIEEAKEIFNKQNHSGASYAVVRNILFDFSDKGPEFYEATADKEIPVEIKKKIEEKKKENEELIALHNSNSNLQELEKGKLRIPYYQVAEQALMNWNGLSKDDADNIINTQSFDEIELQVYATGSMNYAIEGIKKSLGLSDEDAKGLSEFVYEGKKCNVTDNWKKKAENSGLQGLEIKKDFNNLIMDTLFHVHDGWVKDNVKKFNAREKKHQHMPSELIGWKEVKADLLFVRPIFETAGIKVNEEELEKVYNDRVKNFLLNREIETTEDLTNAITKGKEFYPALEGYGEILTTINNPEYVKEKIIPAIEKQGIGNIEEIRQRLVSPKGTNANVDDKISNLQDTIKDKEERVKILTETLETINSLEQRNSELDKQIEELVNKINGRQL